MKRLIDFLNSDKNVICLGETPSSSRVIVVKLFKELFEKTNSLHFHLKEVVKNKKYESKSFILFKGELSLKNENRDILLDILNSIENIELNISQLKKDSLVYRTHSTKVKSKTGLLNVRKNKNLFIESELKTFILSNDLYFEKREDVIVIVENYKIFELDNINEYFVNFDIVLPERFFIAYGSGEAINNEHFINFLNSFKEVLYFGDYDNNGYKIWKNFSKNVDSLFVLPKKEIVEFIQKMIISLNKSDIPEINNELKGLLGGSIIFEMQQEMFLD